MTNRCDGTFQICGTITQRTGRFPALAQYKQKKGKRPTRYSLALSMAELLGNVRTNAAVAHVPGGRDDNRYVPYRRCNGNTSTSTSGITFQQPWLPGLSTATAAATTNTFIPALLRSATGPFACLPPAMTMNAMSKAKNQVKSDAPHFVARCLRSTTKRCCCSGAITLHHSDDHGLQRTRFPLCRRFQRISVASLEG
jgi:hypothetical protein